MTLQKFRRTFGALLFLSVLTIATPLYAQQSGIAPSPQQASPAAAAPAGAIPQQTAPLQPVPESAARPVPSTGRLEREMSPWTMFMSADILVKLVMISLTFASLATWTIFIAKTIQLALARRKLIAALARIADARTLVQAQVALGPDGGILAALLAAAIRECKMSAGSLVESGVKERVASNLVEMIRTEARSVRLGMAVLATIGSTAPFVGLFGTVWGIMNSFIGISKAQTTNLAVVAPGIAKPCWRRRSVLWLPFPR